MSHLLKELKKKSLVLPCIMLSKIAEELFCSRANVDRIAEGGFREIALSLFLFVSSVSVSEIALLLILVLSLVELVPTIDVQKRKKEILTVSTNQGICIKWSIT